MDAGFFIYLCNANTLKYAYTPKNIYLNFIYTIVTGGL